MNSRYPLLLSGAPVCFTAFAWADHDRERWLFLLASPLLWRQGINFYHDKFPTPCESYWKRR